MSSNAFETFVEAVTTTFGLGRAKNLDVTPMKGSANRLWQFSGRRTVVVKELSHDSVEDLPRRREAAAFEQRVYNEGNVVMPQPLRSASGQIICLLTGSRGRPLPVRVHKWLEGDRRETFDRDDLESAGKSLYAIQAVGQKWSSGVGGLSWWDQEPLFVLDRLRADTELASIYDDAGPLLTDALQVVHEGEDLEGDWIFTHCDHKPANALCVRGKPAILDWDECGHCHPRLEAVEAALRWAGESSPDKGAFVAFMDGYSAAGGTVTNLRERDFAKWVAALVGWFCFQSRRALGDYSDDRPSDRAKAAEMARDALMSLRSTVDGLATWAKWS